VFRSVSDQVSLWEAVLPPELLKLPDELARIDELLDDPVFFAPFAPFFDPRVGRPSTPMETYLRLMFLKFRYRLGYESLCREVGDSITWRRFCRIALDGAVPHPTTLMKLSTRCGSAAVEGSHIEPLAAQARPVRTRRHHIKDDARMLDRPQRPVGTVDALILAAQLFALIPQPPGNAHAGRRHLRGVHVDTSWRGNIASK
jgi:transposase, IS5 family